MKKIILLFLLLALAGGGLYAWREYNRTRPSLTGAPADFTTDAATLIAAFEKDTAAANRIYTDKVLAVTGAVKSIDSDGAPAVMFLGVADGMSSVRCSMDSTQRAVYSVLQPGGRVTLKGRCTGGETSDLGLGTDVTLTGAVVVQ